MNIVKQLQLKIVIFTAVKNRCILHGRVFVVRYFKPLAIFCECTAQFVLDLVGNPEDKS